MSALTFLDLEFMFGANVHSFKPLLIYYYFYFTIFSILFYIQTLFLYKNVLWLGTKYRLFCLIIGLNVHYTSILCFVNSCLSIIYFWFFKPSLYKYSHTGSIIFRYELFCFYLYRYLWVEGVRYACSRYLLYGEEII